MKKKGHYPKVFRYQRNPLLLSRNLYYYFFLLVLAGWFLFQNLQAARLLCTSLEPWLLGLPFSLFVTWSFSLLLLFAVGLFVIKWGRGFVARVEKELEKEEA